ncbi:MAG TPA: Hsp20/alpha crystallin family protein [Planctomycetota bacterium]|nr:Hsp20/alpha crystallin family protein [Planctomycetota bacterium]
MKALLPERWRRESDNPVARLQRQMNRLVDDFFRSSEPALDRGEWSPSIDVSENDAEFLVKAEVPGLGKDDLSVTVTGNLLTIKGEKKDERKETKGTWTMVERRYGRFERSIPLPSGVDTEKAQAEFSNGVVTITLPKSEEARAKKIPIKAEKELAASAK